MGVCPISQLPAMWVSDFVVECDEQGTLALETCERAGSVDLRLWHFRLLSVELLLAPV
jgi:hypothetical protein